MKGHLDKVTYISSNLANWNPKLLTFFNKNSNVFAWTPIKENSNVFAWTPVDITNIDLAVITHYLNINLAIKPIQ